MSLTRRGKVWKTLRVISSPSRFAAMTPDILLLVAIEQSRDFESHTTVKEHRAARFSLDHCLPPLSFVSYHDRHFAVLDATPPFRQFPCCATPRRVVVGSGCTLTHEWTWASRTWNWREFSTQACVRLKARPLGQERIRTSASALASVGRIRADERIDWTEPCSVYSAIASHFSVKFAASFSALHCAAL